MIGGVLGFEVLDGLDKAFGVLKFKSGRLGGGGEVEERRLGDVGDELDFFGRCGGDV